MRVYDPKSGALCLEVQVFAEQVVHGIRVSAGHVLVWGSRSVALCPLSAIRDALSGTGDVSFARGQARDWVFDGMLGEESGILVTAHNEVVEIRWHDRKISFGKVISPSRPILYAASVRRLADGQVLVAGGTVFGEILIWTCRVESGEYHVLHVLSGHEGSIFGVSISDEMVLDGKPLRLLASCSDDRTIRVWDISDTTGEGRTLRDKLLHEARETGFGTDALPGPDGDAEEPIALAMGHVSRIWHVKFPPLEGASASVIPIYSFGEDSTAQRWELNITGFQEGEATLQHRETYSNHSGKHIWASAMSSAGGSCRVATGGADGKISLIEGPDLDAHQAQSDGLTMTVISHETLPLLESPQVQGKKGRNRHDILARYAFITDDELLATTRSGKLLLGSFGQETRWSEVPTDGEYTTDLGMTSAVASPRPGLALIGTATKALFLYADGRFTKLGDAPGKVLNLIPLSTDEENVTFLLTMHRSPEIRVLTAKLSTNEITSDVALQGVDERFVLTSAALFHGYLALGSRNGFMVVFAVQGNNNYTLLTQIGPRSDDTVTSIHALPGQTPGPAITFLTTNRDGKYRIYELETAGPQPIVHLRHETPPPFGPLIEDAWFAEKGDDGPPHLILSGFRSKDFVVWDETAREYITSIDCGGGHRTFAHTKSSSSPHRLRFAFTKAATVYIRSQARAASRTVKVGAHGSEVRAIAGAELRGASYFATGSEDTSVRIWERREGAGEAPSRCVASMKLHTAGIQSVKWCGDYVLSSGGNEELYAWRVSALPAGFGGLGVFCEGTLEDKTPDGDLRIMDFDVCEAGSGLKLTVVFSNSVFKTYRYERPGPGNREGRFEGVAVGEYTGACLTQVRQLGEAGDVLTASTDGHIALWRPADGVFALVGAARVHQSSIKSLDIREEGHGYLVITTGDDNALGVTSLAFNDGALAVLGRTIIRSAHAAAINGVVVLPGGRVATVSNDQRVKIWRVGASGPSVELVENRYSGVADAGTVDYLPRRKELLVGGVGMEVWEIGS